MTANRPPEAPEPTPAPTGAEPAAPGSTPPPASSSSSSTPKSSKKTAGGSDPLRGSRTSGYWAAVLAFALVLLLLAIFIIQNTTKVEISYFGWSGRAPLAAALLIAAVAGAVIVASAGAMRILQLRRRVRRDRKG